LFKHTYGLFVNVQALILPVVGHTRVG
jgi:hypothetical protein